MELSIEFIFSLYNKNKLKKESLKWINFLHTQLISKKSKEQVNFYVHCGVSISPDDETEDVYSILEAKVKNNKLENLLIKCNNCLNKILLTGFSILE